jgi:hypothetical protein
VRREAWTRWLGMWRYRIAERSSAMAEPILGWQRSHEWLCPFCRGMGRHLREVSHDA